MKTCVVCNKTKSLAEYYKCTANTDGLQRHCSSCQKEYSKKYEAMHKKKRAEINAKSRERLGKEYWYKHHQKLKQAMIMAYGGKCECCNETEITFLSLDHVNGGGARERKKVGSGNVLWRKLRDAGWPKEGYRILCLNCQFGYLNGRTCPHQLNKSKT